MPVSEDITLEELAGKEVRVATRQETIEEMEKMEQEP